MVKMTYVTIGTREFEKGDKVVTVFTMNENHMIAPKETIIPKGLAAKRGISCRGRPVEDVVRPDGSKR